MATVILVRHGRTSANASGILAGRLPGVLLDDVGEEQARDAGRRLAALPLRAVVSSPLERCRATADHLAAAQAEHRPVEEEPGLLECDYGAWQGRTIKELSQEPLWRTVQDHPSAAVFPEGESLRTMAHRAVDAVRSWDALVESRDGPGALWVAVSHGDVIKAVLSDAAGAPLDQFQRIVVDPGSLSIVRYTPQRPFVLGTNLGAGDLSRLLPTPDRAGERGVPSGDAVLGGGAGPAPGVDPGS